MLADEHDGRALLAQVRGQGELEAMEPGNLKSIYAFAMDPTAEDKALMDNVLSRRQRVERGSRKSASSSEVSTDASDDDAPATVRKLANK